MKKVHGPNTITTGLAMFSMFFGAGNVVFPLVIGQEAADKNFYAILGLLITAVGVPFIGLIGMTLFDGCSKRFFERIGKVPGFLVTLFIIGLIGPFGAAPRTITLSYSTLKLFMPTISLPVFSFLSCVFIYLLTFKRKNILDFLGDILTPILLLSLGIILIKGLLHSPEWPNADHEKLSIFFHGLVVGYQTMDLLAAFFFSSVVIFCLKKSLASEEKANYKLLTTLTLKASCIGASLLGIVYIGFSYVSALHSTSLAEIPPNELLPSLAILILGPYAAIIACIAVSLACLTTAIALSAVFAEYVHEDLTLKKIGYKTALTIALIITFCMSILDFTGIMAILTPILMLCYPALIVLSVLNICYKLYDYKPVKIPVLVTLILTFIGYWNT